MSPSLRSKPKPLIVLAGWLGCQKRSLRRYDTFFTKLGYDVMPTVAPPAFVVGSCFTPQTTLEPLHYPPQWPYHGWTPTSMQGFAWEILRYIHNHNCEYFLFYAFSNGGCFVWEQLSRILNQQHGNIITDEATAGSAAIMDEDAIKGRQKILETLHKKAAGVIFDSCPSKRLGEVSRALTLCTWSDRFEVMRMPQGGLNVAFFPSLVPEEKKEKANQRGASYHDNLKTDPWNLPQLYLYSRDDVLIPSDGIDELYNHRKETIGTDRILRRRWEASRHCAHFIDHPKEYEVTMTAFLDLAREIHSGAGDAISNQNVGNVQPSTRSKL